MTMQTKKTCRYLVLLTASLTVGAWLSTPAASYGASGYDRSNSEGRQLMLQASADDLNAIAALYDLTIVGEVIEGHDLVLVETPVGVEPEALAAVLSQDPSVQSVDSVTLASLPGTEAGSLASGQADAIAPELAIAGSIASECLAGFVSTDPWAGFLHQQSAQLIGLPSAYGTGECGDRVVAIIDTGIDPSHPVLVGSIISGFDFLLDQPGVPSEWLSIDQSVRAIVEQSLRAIVAQSVARTLTGQASTAMAGPATAVIIDQSVRAIVEGTDLPPAFGHGTMVAGLVRLIAPGASIMPLRAFDGSGKGHVFDIVRAVYYAVDNGADVINMSFSMEELSPELVRAVAYAQSNGVVCVAAAGNRGGSVPVFPAAESSVIGVAATDLLDSLASFSNHGPAWVDLAAPGTGVISLFPGGLYAGGWGTSFSAAIASGAAALIAGSHAGEERPPTSVIIQALVEGSSMIPLLEGLVSSGRIDVYRSLSVTD